MIPKILSWLLSTFLLTTVSRAEAQQQVTKVSRIGYMASAGSGPSPVFLQGLRDLGYVEGKNIAFVFRTTEGKNERYSDLALELARLNVDIVVVGETRVSAPPRRRPAQSLSSCQVSVTP